MEKIVGSVVSKSSGRSYIVKWDSEQEVIWISRGYNMWEQVYENVSTIEAALSCAQNFIDSQPYVY